MQPHDLVRLRLIAGHTINAFSDQFLNELYPGSLVFDQDVAWPNPFGLVPNRAFRVGIVQPLVEMLNIDALFTCSDSERAVTLRRLPHGFHLTV